MNLDAFGLTDAGRRAADSINALVSADPHGLPGRWIAVRLSDGGSDGVAYDTRADAIRNQLHEQLCAYVCVPPMGTTAAEMTAWLRLHRQLYDAGLRLIDPDREVIPTQAVMRQGGLWTP